MLKIFPAARLIVMLVIAGGGFAVTKKAAAEHMLPPSVMHAIGIINDHTSELVEAFN